jgi:hypothetical protein
LSVVFSQYSYSNAWSEIQILKEEWMNEWIRELGERGRKGCNRRDEVQLWRHHVGKCACDLKTS